MYQVRLSNEQLPSVVGYGLLATAEGFYHADRNLPCHVLIYVLEGAIYVTEDGVDYAVKPGQLLFLKSGLRHFGKRQIPRGTRWYYVHFALPQPAVANDAGQPLQTAGGVPWLPLPKQLSHLTGSSIEKELGAFVEACHSREETTRWYLNQQLFVLLSHIAHQDRPETPSPDLAQRIAQYLRQHAREPFRAKELERAFFLSYKHMAAVFKKSRAQTMHEYHQHLRMEEGARLLRETLLPVGEISEQLGFADQLYFSRCFHEFAGVSPTEYRRQVRDY